MMRKQILIFISLFLLLTTLSRTWKDSRLTCVPMIDRIITRLKIIKERTMGTIIGRVKVIRKRINQIKFLLYRRLISSVLIPERPSNPSKAMEPRNLPSLLQMNLKLLEFVIIFKTMVNVNDRIALTSTLSKRIQRAICKWFLTEAPNQGEVNEVTEDKPI
jgi:hypothetical protein